MIERYLSILEVSQKQAYIFASNRLAENVRRSAEIWWLTEPAKIQELIGDRKLFDSQLNTVYAGGGHTVLAFDTYEKVIEFHRRYSFMLRTMNPEIEVFLFALPYCSKVSARRMLEHVYSDVVRGAESDEQFAAGEASKGFPAPEECSPSAYLKELTRGLERKKAFRRASFHQGSFGVEEIEASTRSVRVSGSRGVREMERSGSVVYDGSGGKAKKYTPESFLYRSAYDGNPCPPEEQCRQAARFDELKKANQKVEGSNPVPEGYAAASKFEDLGGTRGDINLLAVVHIDGNGMGARCSRFYEGLSGKYGAGSREEAREWEEFREAVNRFSREIDRDFKKALSNMFARVGRSIAAGNLEDLSLKSDPRTGMRFFPIRGIIASGDDICFVTDGRIGIECAAAFLEELAELTNEADKKSYSASAGVTIVHQKYPFFRAYELAEALCGSAKEFAAGLRIKQREKFLETNAGAETVPEELLDNGAGICAIDWHLEMGEIGMTLEDVRREYRIRGTINGMPGHLEMRPYVVKVQSDPASPNDVMTIEPHRQYDAFRKQMKMYLKTKGMEQGTGEDVHARLKELRGILKEGNTEAAHYIRFHKLKGMILDNYYGIFKEIGFRDNTEDIPLFVCTADGQARSVLFDAAEAIEIYSLM